MSTGHAIPFVMFYGVQYVSDQVGEETPLEGYGVEVSHRIPRSDRWKEGITDEGNIITESQDEHGFIKFQHLIL